jgi:hypothetical protein
MKTSARKTWVLAGVGAIAAAVVALAVSGTGAARSTTAPSNTSPPTITGTPQQGATLTAQRGQWSNNPTSYSYFWTRCDDTGGSCSDINGATDKTYTLKGVDVGNTLRARVKATNADGSSSATSVPTAVIKPKATPPPPPPPPPATGCPSGNGPAQVSAVMSPARLLLDGLQSDPNVVHRGGGTIVVRIHVSDTCGQAVQGALVYGTAIPYNQLSIPPETPTGSDGWAELDFHALAGFPVSRNQSLIAIFARARKQGENLLAGISTRRLFSIRVNLHS